MVETNHLLCSKAVAVPAPKVEVNDTDSKDKLVAALKSSSISAPTRWRKWTIRNWRRRRKDSAESKLRARLDQPSPSRHLGRPLRRSRNVSAPERCVAADCQEVSLL